MWHIVKTFDLVLQFDSDTSEEEGQRWLSELLDVMPTGTSGRMVRPPRVVAVPDLGPEHEGYNIWINRGHEHESIRGRLDTVYPAGTSQNAKVLVIDGRAFDAKAYEVATLTES